MSITDPLILAFDGKYMAWTIRQGRECFCDEEGVMRLWDTPEDARVWARKNLGLDPLDVLPEAIFDENAKKP